MKVLKVFEIKLISLVLFSILSCLHMFVCAACCKGQLGFAEQTFMSMGQPGEKKKSIKNSCFTNSPNKIINVLTITLS